MDTEKMIGFHEKLFLFLINFFLWSWIGSDVFAEEANIQNKNIWEEPKIIQISSNQNFAPKISAKESSIFFVSDIDSNLNLYKKNLSGGGLKQITFHPALDTEGIPSPNGKHLLWISKRNDALGDIHIMKLGFNLFQLSQSSKDENSKHLAMPNSSESEPTWLENSKDFFFLSKRNQETEPTLWKANVNDLKAVQILNHPMDSYSVSRDGKYLIFFYQHSMYSVDLSQDKLSPKILSKTTKWITQPLITEDLKYLYFTQYAYDTNRDLNIDEKDNPTIWRVPFVNHNAFNLCETKILKCMEPITSSYFESSNPFIMNEILYFTGNHNHQWLSLQSIPQDGHIKTNLPSEKEFVELLRNIESGSKRHYLATKFLALSYQSNNASLIEYFTKWVHLTDPDFLLDPSSNPNLSLGNSIKILENLPKDDFYSCFLRYYTAKNFLKQNNTQAAAIFFEQSSLCEKVSTEISTQSMIEIQRLGLSESFISKNQKSSASYISQFYFLGSLTKLPLKIADMEANFDRFTFPELQIEYLKWIYKSAPKYSLETVYDLSKKFNPKNPPLFILNQFLELKEQILLSLAEYYLNMSETNYSLKILSKLIEDNPLHLMARKMQLDLVYSQNQIENQIQILREDVVAFPNNTERSFFLSYAEYLRTKKVVDLYLKMESISSIQQKAYELLQRNNQIAIYHWFYAKLSLELKELQDLLVEQKSFTAFTFYRSKILKNFFGFEDQNLIVEAIESAKTSLQLTKTDLQTVESRVILADSFYEIASYSSSLKEYLQLIQNNSLNQKGLSNKKTEIHLKASRSAYMAEEFNLAIGLQKNMISQIDWSNSEQTALYVKSLERLSLYQYVNQDYESSIQTLKQILDDAKLSPTLTPTVQKRLRVLLGLNLFLNGKNQASLDALNHELASAILPTNKRKKPEKTFVLSNDDIEIIRIKLIRRNFEVLKDYQKSLIYHQKEIGLLEKVLQEAKSEKKPNIQFEIFLSKHQEIYIYYKMEDLNTANTKMRNLMNEILAEQTKLSGIKELPKFLETLTKNNSFLQLRSFQQNSSTNLSKEDFISIESLESFKFISDFRKVLQDSSTPSAENNELSKDLWVKVRTDRKAFANSTANLGLLEGISSLASECSKNIIESIFTDISKIKSGLKYDLNYCFKKSFPEIVSQKNFLEILAKYIQLNSLSDQSSLNLEDFLKELKQDEFLVVDIFSNQDPSENKFLLLSRKSHVALIASADEIKHHIEQWFPNDSINHPRLAFLRINNSQTSKNFYTSVSNLGILWVASDHLDSLLDELQKSDSFFQVALTKDKEILSKMNQFACYKNYPQAIHNQNSKTLTIKMKILKNIFDFVYACPEYASEVTDYLQSVESFDLRPHEPWAEKVISIINFELKCIQSVCKESDLSDYVIGLGNSSEVTKFNDFAIQIAKRFLLRNQKIQTSSIQQEQRFRIVGTQAANIVSKEIDLKEDCDANAKRPESLLVYFKCLTSNRNELQKLGYKTEWFKKIENEIAWAKHRKRPDLEYILNMILIEDYILDEEFNLAANLIARNRSLRSDDNLSSYGLNIETLNQPSYYNLDQVVFNPNYFDKLILVYILKSSTFEKEKTQFTESWHRILDPNKLDLLQAKSFIHRFEIMQQIVTLSNQTGGLNAWDITPNINKTSDNEPMQTLISNKELYSKFFENKVIDYLFYESEKLILTFKFPSSLILRNTEFIKDNKLSFKSICLDSKDIEFSDEFLGLLHRRFKEIPWVSCELQMNQSVRLRLDRTISTRKKMEQIRNLSEKLQLVKKIHDSYDLKAVKDIVQTTEGLYIDTSDRF